MGIRLEQRHLKRTRETPSVLFEVAMQSTFQGKFSCTVAIQGLLRWMRAFAVANEEDRGGVSVVASAAFADSSAASLHGMPL